MGNVTDGKGADAGEGGPKAGARTEIRLPVRHNARLAAVIERVNADEDLDGLWRAMNVNAVDRLGMTDHGPVHFQIVSNIALRLLRLLVEGGIVPSVVRDHGLGGEEAELVVVVGALLHDLGMSIARPDHEVYSLFVAQPKIDQLLGGLYEAGPRAILRSEILHAIISHRSEGRPMTVEAGIVRVADALDMAKGRSRIPFEAGVVNIHSISAAAIEKVEIVPGKARPIHIDVHMNNSAGVFQLDELLKEKIRGSGLEAHIEVEAFVQGEGEGEKRLLDVYRI